MSIKRNIFKELVEQIKEPKTSILLGARQVGKTTLLRELDLAAQGLGLKTAFFNLELSADLEQMSGDHKQVLEKISAAGDVVFLDEFHYLENASKIFKALYDSRRKVKIFASGSSSLEIHKHLKESLAGRFVKTMIFPLSWEEAARAPGFGFQDYLQWGGMPGLLHQVRPDQKAALLQNIVDTYLGKDIKGLIKEENVRAFNSLLYLLAQNQGSVLVAANLARETGLHESTVARHLEVMSQTYVCHAVMSYSKNLANELKKSKKCYLFDLGIRNSLLKDFRLAAERDDKGIVHESAVFQQLLPQLKPNMEIRFWRTKKGEEVDFILINNRVPVPVEVKSGLQEPQVPSGLRAFLRSYPEAPFGLVFSEKLETEIRVEGRPVRFQPLSASGKVDYLQDIF